MLRNLVLSVALLVPNSAFSRVINFEVQGFRPDLPEGGLPWAGQMGIFGPNAYDVEIFSSPFVEENRVFLDSNPANQNPFIDGYFLFANSRFVNWVDISFSSAKDLSFDFGTVTGWVHVQLWGPGGGLLVEGYAQGPDEVPFLLSTGTAYTTGLLDLSEYGEVGRLRIDSIWESHNLIVDNIFYRPAPEPGILLLIIAGLGLILRREA